MGIGEIVLIGLGLSMDAVAVSASNAMCFPRERLRLLEMAAWFAVFQGAMPLAGFLAAGAASDLVTRMGGWLALLILGWVGGQMIRSGLSHEEERCPAGGLTRRTLLVQAVATSIDALAVGGIARRRRAACGKTAISEFQGGLKVAVVAPTGACPLNFDGRSARRGKLGVDL